MIYNYACLSNLYWNLLIKIIYSITYPFSFNIIIILDLSFKERVRLKELLLTYCKANQS